MSNGKMKVVIVEPGKPAYVSEIGTDLASMQKVVGGYIETIYFIDEPNVIMVGNEEAKLIGLEGNRRFGKAIVAGTFFISGQAECDDGMVFCSLTDELCDKFVKQFAIPEEISQEEIQSDMGFTVTTFGSTMSDTVREQILAVRETGLTNMFDKRQMKAKNKRFWEWRNSVDPETKTEERTLHLNGAIAEESWFDDDVTPQLFKEELFSGEGDITLWINSPGGDCVAAAQIYNMLMDYKGNITVKIDGIAASAASVIAMAGNTVLMSPVSMLMIHNPATIAFGDCAEMQKANATLYTKQE